MECPKFDFSFDGHSSTWNPEREFIELVARVAKEAGKSGARRRKLQIKKVVPMIGQDGERRSFLLPTSISYTSNLKLMHFEYSFWTLPAPRKEICSYHAWRSPLGVCNKGQARLRKAFYLVLCRQLQRGFTATNPGRIKGLVSAPFFHVLIACLFVTHFFH